MEPLISFIAPQYNDYPMVIPSLMAQTYKNWEVLIIHDGPIAGTQDEKDLAPYLTDPRVKLFETEKPGRDWGHAAREYGIQFLSPESKYVIFGSTDNYYMPLFFEFMVKPFMIRPDIEATFCNMVHNNFAWEKMDCSIRMGRIDCGNFMTKTENARAVGWKHRHYEADWAYIQAIQQRFCKSPTAFYKVDKILFVHN